MKINVSINGGKSFSENIFFLELWSIGNTNSEKTIGVKGGQNFSGTFKQIQFAFDKDHVIFLQNIILIKRDLTKNTKVLLQNLLYQDYQRVTQTRLSE